MTSYNVGSDCNVWIFTVHDQKLWHLVLLGLPPLSYGTGAMGFISMTEPSKLAKKAIGSLNTAWIV